MGAGPIRPPVAVPTDFQSLNPRANRPETEPMPTGLVELTAIPRRRAAAERQDRA